MFLIIDNYDSFVYNLSMYFKDLSHEVVMVRNDKVDIEIIEELNPEAIIISPGPKDPRDTGNLLDIIKYFKGKIPMLGVCLGHQSIAYAFGGNIIKGDKPIHGKVTPIYHENKGVFKDLKNPINVTRYHSLIVEKSTLSPEFIITATTEDGVIMGIRDEKKLIEGVQFHPEALLTEMGHEMLKNFIKDSKEFNLRMKRSI